jgi:hypothetical protein
VRWKPDQIDVWCGDWGRERRKSLGISLDKDVPWFEKLTPRERLGKLNCTLGQVKDDAEGASQGTVKQNFPEVYTGLVLDVHRGYSSMGGGWRLVMNAQYVWVSVPAKDKAEDMGLTVRRYFEQLDQLKAYLAGWLQVDPAETVRKAYGSPTKVLGHSPFATSALALG